VIDRIFVIGGGPSLTGFDWSRLDGEFVVSSNFSAPRPSVSVVNDVRIIRTPEVLAKWLALPGEHVFVNRQCAEQKEIPPSVRVVPAVEEWSASLERGVLACNNCGLAALNFADILGARTIYLLGFDMAPVNGRTAHWHEGIYPADWGSDGRAYVNMLRQFGRWAEFVRAKVVNLNPESALECFEKADRDEVLGTRAPWRKPA
jgi:hypothetical protein